MEVFGAKLQLRPHPRRTRQIWGIAAISALIAAMALGHSCSTRPEVSAEMSVRDAIQALERDNLGLQERQIAAAAVISQSRRAWREILMRMPTDHDTRRRMLRALQAMLEDLDDEELLRQHADPSDQAARDHLRELEPAGRDSSDRLRDR